MKRLWIIAVLLAAVAAVWFSFRQATKPPSHQAIDPTVPLSSLIRLDGRLCRTNDTQPFTGLAVEQHQNGTLKSRSMIVNGVLHGLSEGWFTNGQKQVTENFTNGVSHGVRSKWYADGQKHSEAMIASGEFHGTFRHWHPNGALAEHVQFSNGQPEGMSLAYFQSGFLKARARLEAGKVLEQQFWKDGEASERGPAGATADAPTAH
jgi:antitoxin component YwqK of YwqJK toxin-antitoxin module